MTNLKRIANFIILVLLLLAVLGYFITSSEYDKIVQNTEMLFLQDKVNAELFLIHSHVRELKLISAGVYDLTADQIADGITYEKDAAVAELKSELNSSLVLIQELQNQISFSNIELSAEHRALVENDEISMSFGKRENFWC